LETLARLGPRIHVFAAAAAEQTQSWTAGTSPAEGVFGCIGSRSRNPISGTGQQWVEPGRDNIGWQRIILAFIAFRS
jgi:hypothetical protein